MCNPAYLWDMESKGKRELKNDSQISRLCNRMDGNTLFWDQGLGSLRSESAWLPNLNSYWVAELGFKSTSDSKANDDNLL